LAFDLCLKIVYIGSKKKRHTMAKLKIIASNDFNESMANSINFGAFSLYTDPQKLFEHKSKNAKGFFAHLGAVWSAAWAAYLPEIISFSEIEDLEVIGEDKVKKIGGTVVWGAVGAVAAGPVGMLAGLLLGGKGKDVTFKCTFKDGRGFMASVDSKTWVKLQAKIFGLE
jgi:hypothetical protein